MSEIKFGTDGWRAIIAEEFTFTNVRRISQGIAAYMKAAGLVQKGVIIGYDNRFLSESFARACAEVMLGNGIKTFLFKKAAPTPLTAFAIRNLQAGGAVMITASHNPPEYNGLKFIPEYAGPALPDVTDQIEAEVDKVLDGGRIYVLDVNEAAKLELFKEIDLDKEYFAHLLHLVNGEVIREHPLKVVVNPMYGAGINYLDRILTELGCEVKTINNYRDTMFGGSMPEPTDVILSDLKRAVQTFGANLGLALDGDADRFGLVDAEGNYISPNQFGALLLNYLLGSRAQRGPVCRSVATTHVLDRIAREFGIEVIETPVGFKYIGQGLREKSAMLGIEESGGLSVMGHVPEKDGILACLLAVEMLAARGCGFTELQSELDGNYGKVFSKRIDIRVNDLMKAQVLSALNQFKPKRLAGTDVSEITAIDGRQFVLVDGSWALVRVSGTEPLFRIYVEAGSEERIEQIRKEVMSAIGLN
ncbi:MAG: phosphoglucomutase/phosphomannomutase family protein [Syntrophomonadaceae bacterium]|nr:phosphoglucomutase/phosphomannomutase family protein [Syntrophomonadaceae bacterium]